MKAEFWMERWRASEIGFHQGEVHELLQAYWPGLGLAPGSTVLVPLCGKSLDMIWLAAQGHNVVGVELSPIAVDAFFAEHGLTPETVVVGSFTVKRAPPFTLYCGDILNLTREMMADVVAVYDRAALVALPPEMQPAYVRKLVEVLPAGTPILLVTLAYPEGQLKGPPFSTSLVELAALFGRTHELTLLHTRDGLEKSQNLVARGVTRLEEAAYLIRPKS